MCIGENIRRRRLELNMSQQQLATAMGYRTRSSIAKIENGTADIPHSKLTALANVLNATVEYLLTGVLPQIQNKNLVVSSAFQTTFPEIPSDDDQNSSTEKVVAVILAGGSSTRNHQNTPNQFVNANNKPIIMYTMETYQHHPAIDAIYVVSLSGWEGIISAYAKQYNITKLAGIIPAGTTGALSVKASVEWLSSHLSFHDIVIFQESTRPMVTEEMISKTIQCTREHGSAITYEPMDEYLQFLENDIYGVEYIDRSKILSIQSPEGYIYRKLYKTIIDATKIQHAFDETCCAMIMYNLGKKLVFCEGNRYNIKIVRQEDLKMFEAFITKKQ